MIPLKIIFWILIFGVCYTYVFYGVILYLFGNHKKRSVSSSPTQLPSVVHIIAAYNEAEIIEQKIKNALQLQYPKDKLKTVVVADGSTDATVEIVRRFPDIILIFDPIRKGKLAAINHAVAVSQDAEVLVFSDANTMLNPESLLKMMGHYQDPMVGGIAAEKKVVADKNGMVRGEGLYWRYESKLKKLEADFYTVVGAAGELFSIRRKLYRPLPEHIILDDLMISLDICRKGYVVQYEPDAFAIEGPSRTLSDEQKRKVRISAGAFQILSLTADLLNPFTYDKLSFQYISHRLMRWIFCPIAIPLIFILNSLIMVEHPEPIYLLLYFIQIVFYLMGLIGWARASAQKSMLNIFYIPFYASFMQIAQWKGFAASLKGEQTQLWEKAQREYTHLNGL